MVNIDKLILTLFLKTLHKSPALISEDEVRLLIEEADNFVKGKIWIRYEPILNTLICKIVEDKKSDELVYYGG